MQIFSTSLLCHTSNCKLQETKIRRQTTIAKGIRNLGCVDSKSRTGWPLWGNLLCWLLLHFWQTSFEVSFGYKLFEVHVFGNRELFPDFCVTLLSVTSFSGMPPKKKNPKTATVQWHSFHVLHKKPTNFYWFWLTKTLAKSWFKEIVSVQFRLSNQPAKLLKILTMPVM